MRFGEGFRVRCGRAGSGKLGFGAAWVSWLGIARQCVAGRSSVRVSWSGAVRSG